MFNWSDHPADCRIKFEELGFAAGVSMHVFDFWNRQYWRVTEPEMVFHSVPAHGCKLLRVCEVLDVAQLVGDSLHISQGAEIASWQEESGRLLIETVDMGRQVEGMLWLAVAKPPSKVTCNDFDGDLVDLGEGVYGLRLRFMGKGKIEVRR